MLQIAEIIKSVFIQIRRLTMKRKDIEKYTKEFLEIYKKNLSNAGLNESAQTMLIFILQQSMRDWIKKTNILMRRK
jgi:hypothetical protein